MNTTPRKILFVTPPYHCGVTEVAGRWVPLGLAYLAGAARQAGLAPVIYDAMAKDHGYREVEERLAAERADYVAATAITATVGDAVRTLELAKRANPAAVTILGGIHPTFMYDEVLNSPAVDYVVCGEGEETLRELLTVLEAGGDPAGVPGLAFRRDGATALTAKRPLAADLDALPAAWDLLDWQDYSYFVIPQSRLGAVSTSRGCRHDCTFCSPARFWDRTWRGREPERVVEELDHLHRTYGTNVFLVTDEHPTRDRERWEAILDLLIARELPVSFLMETRVPDIVRDGDILRKYRKAGIVHVSLGVEATNQATLDRVRKDASVDQAGKALDLLRENGIVSEASFMLGFPGETSETVKRTLQMAQQYNPDNANFLAVTPWPYSDMYEEMKPYIRVHDYGKYNLVDPVLEPEGMSLLQMDVALADCYRKFYMGKIIEVMTMKNDFRRSYLLRATKLFMSSPYVLRKLGIGILGRIPAKLGEMTKK